MATTASRKLKILALHGHAMSGEGLRAKMGAIRTDTKKLADWYFPDAPISIADAEAFSHPDALSKSKDSPNTSSASPVPAANEANTKGDSPKEGEGEGKPSPPPGAALYSWYDFSKVNHALSEGLDLFKPVPVQEVKEPLYTGMPEALAHLGSYCQEHGPFDILFSFSQGTILAALIVCQMNLRRAAAANPEKDEDPELALLSKRLPVIPELLDQPFTCAIFSSGLPAKDPYYTQILQHAGFKANTENPIRSLHLWGATDEIISPEWSKQLMGYPVFMGEGKSGEANKEEGALTTKVNSLVEYASHDGGHVVASIFRKPIKAFLQSLIPETEKKPAKSGKQPKQPKKEKGNQEPEQKCGEESEATKTS